MKSLFQNIRSGAISKEACKLQLVNYQRERASLTRLLSEKKIGIDLYKKRMGDLKFSMDLLQIVVNDYDKLKTPMKIPVKDKTNY